jgi:hypothetical protein
VISDSPSLPTAEPFSTVNTEDCFGLYMSLHVEVHLDFSKYNDKALVKRCLTLRQFQNGMSQKQNFLSQQPTCESKVYRPFGFSVFRILCSVFLTVCKFKDFINSEKFSIVRQARSWSDFQS